MGKIIKHEMYIDTLKRNRDVYVYLPYNYNNSNKSYDVIYMHDAQNVFFANKSYSGKSWGVLENFNNENQTQCIFVCVDHGEQYRISEYGVLEHSNNALNFVKEGKIPKDIEGHKYIKWLVKSLVPFINNNYKTKNTLNTTSIIGSSMGGLISLYAICKYPNVFGNAGVLSPSFWFCNDTLYDLVMDSKFNGKIYMSVGTNENGIEISKAYIEGATKMANILTYKGDFTYRVVQDGIHNEGEWAKLMPNIVNYFLN